MFSRPVPYPYDCDGWLVANIHDDIAKSQNDADNSVDTDEPAQSGVTLKSEAEIKAMNKKSRCDRLCGINRFIRSVNRHET